MGVTDIVEDTRGRFSLEANISTERKMGRDIAKEVGMEGNNLQRYRAVWGICYLARLYMFFICFILFSCHNSLGSRCHYARFSDGTTESQGDQVIFRTAALKMSKVIHTRV